MGRSGAYAGSSQFSLAVLLGASGGRARSKHGACPRCQPAGGELNLEDD